MAAGNVKVEEVTMVSYADGSTDVQAPWPLSWSAVWVGTLAAVALVLILGLVGIAIGAHRVGHPLGTWHDMSFLALIWSVLAAFLYLKSAREEAWLEARYPGYAAYRARTPRFIPWPGRSRGSVGRSSRGRAP